jgi:hypothetical protein
MSRPAYLGFPLQILGCEGPKSHDAHRQQGEPRPSVSLGCLRELFTYLDDGRLSLEVVS